VDGPARHPDDSRWEDRKEIKGHAIELVVQDGHCTPEGGFEAAKRLADDPFLVAIVGTTCSSEAREAIPGDMRPRHSDGIAVEHAPRS